MGVTKIVLFFGDGSGESEVSDFDFALGVDEEVGWFEIPVDELSGVDVLEAFEELVDDVLGVDGSEEFGPDDPVEVCFHELEDHVEVLVVVGLDDGEELDDVVVVGELVEEDDLAVGSLGIG